MVFGIFRKAELGAKLAIAALAAIIVMQGATIWLLLDRAGPLCAP